MSIFVLVVLVGGTGMARAGRHFMSGHAWSRVRSVGVLPARRAGAQRGLGGRTARVVPHAPRLSAAAASQAKAGVPASARVGAIFDSDGTHHCTASVVGPDLIVTAAHCGTDGGRFAPGFHDGRSPYGRWRLGDRLVDRAWRTDRDEDHDVAFVQVLPLGGRHLGEAVGFNAIGFNRGFDQRVTVTGYPTGGSAPVSGASWVTRYDARQMRVRIPGLADGSSGGPWVTPQGEVIGVVGGHDTGGDYDNVSYSVYFGDSVRTLYLSADSSSQRRS